MITKRFGLLGLFLFSLGCGSKIGDVSGMIRFDGEPLPNGRVVFYCKGGEQPVLMSSIINGEYSIEGAPTGKATVTVETFETKTTPVPGQFGSPMPSDQEPEETLLGDYVRIPERFRSPVESGLDFEIVPGENSYDIELEQ